MSSPEAARQRALVRRGYDSISRRYRSDDGRPDGGSDEDPSQYRAWLGELDALLPRAALVADLGCGNGVPAARWLASVGHRVVGIDFSAVQLGRARRLVPDAALAQADLAELGLRPGRLDAAIALYSLIHLPLVDQVPLLGRIASWLCPGGLLLAIVGHERWTGEAPYLGGRMFWDHADRDENLRLLDEAGFAIVWDRYVPEGASGHTLVLARRQ